MKYENFNKELEFITDERLRNNAMTILNNLPDYFFQVQAASTGKYHPSYALGEKGLVRHTKAAVCIANNLFNIYKFDDHTKDYKNVLYKINSSIKDLTDKFR